MLNIVGEDRGGEKWNAVRLGGTQIAYDQIRFFVGGVRRL
jgi:hypothetical protein